MHLTVSVAYVSTSLLAEFFAASMQHLWMAASLSLGMRTPTWQEP